MDSLSRWVQRHQTIAFILLTLCLSWGCWVLAFLLFPEDELIQAPLVKIGVYAPALVAMYISSIGHHRISTTNAPVRWTIFGASWLAAWLHLVLYAHVVSDYAISTKLVVVGGITATLPAYVISCAFAGNEGIKSLLASVIRPTGNPALYLLAVLIVPLTMVMGAAATVALAGSLPGASHSWQQTTLLGILGTTALVFLNELAQAGGLPEEPGWRGFALPRLQARFSPLASSMILGPIWAIWHGPLLIGMLQSDGPWRVALRILVLGITFTWLYNRTKGSLFAMLLLHASWNTALALLPRTDIFLLLMIASVIAMVVSNRMWVKRPTECVVP